MSEVPTRETTAHEGRVLAMMQGFKQETPASPTAAGDFTRCLRARLHLEEAVLEYATAAGLGMSVDLGGGCQLILPHDITRYRFFSLQSPDVVGIADALGDASVVVTGSFVAHGIPVEPVVKAIDDNNLLKLARGHTDPETGKFIKPKDHPAVDLLPVLQAAGYVETKVTE